MEVIVKNCKSHPSCPHGPCLMFERHTSNGIKSGKKFYACSACRDRSVCNFFHWVDDDFSTYKREHWEQIIAASKPPYIHDEYVKRRTSFQNLPQHERKYCRTCSLLILKDIEDHNNHEIIDNVSEDQLLQPTTLFQTLENKKSEAQYFFSPKTIHFVTSLLQKLKFTKVVLIGVPKIHEYLMSNKTENTGLTSFLMDIDHRYMQFFGPEQFCHYNLFNNHFFGGKASKKKFKEFLTEKNGEKVAILLDPPFGGLIDAICYTLQKMNQYWQKVNSKESTETVPIIWFFPYFLEPRIVQTMPDLVMMDYKVEYLNHKKFGSQAGSIGSPVRIFTNINGSSFVLPKNEGYKYCKICQRYVSKENQHCSKCNKCTTKHGNTFKHCNSCKQCVKSSYVHCEVHNKCVPDTASHTEISGKICKCNRIESEGEMSNKCFKCFGYGHRKRDCTGNSKNQKGRRKKMKK
ncbi:rRNA N6-adenosine-methyltransferase ZCCHC4 like protein [Argiope bruennichi]|uniref:rRNA N6-adenosine-methyltransferase ZCCHC4 like protein n=1 Tax=Argiope bruennichi TaxID=94029 RepID=A0A8T0FZE9_ARGBR|nr:rRNA N6-adenosine-methyltransferase ZCCHC4 like protein [Argiope bruennichi]